MMNVATGILPHTKIIKDFNEFATKLHNLSLKVYNLHVCLQKSVSGTIEDNMAPVEAAEKNSDTVPRKLVLYYVYMYYGKLGIHVPSHFDLPGNT